MVENVAELVKALALLVSVSVMGIALLILLVLLISWVVKIRKAKAGATSGQAPAGADPHGAKRREGRTGRGASQRASEFKHAARLLLDFLGRMF